VTPNRPTIEHEYRTADRTLSAFARARALAIRARQSKDRAMAAELDQLAWSLVKAADPVRLGYAQRRLGISDPTTRAWVDRGILSLAGRSPRRVTLESVARAEEIATELHLNGQERELGAALERHLEWQRMRREPEFERGLELIGQMRGNAPCGHRTAELRSLAFHRQVAQALDPQAVSKAQARVNKWVRDNGPVPRTWAKQWRTLLERPLAEIKQALTTDSEQMRELRQNTPFAGALSEADRMRLIGQTH
jgi:hypothetical protein